MRSGWLLFTFALSVHALAQSATLFQAPALNQTHIVFVYAGDLWTVPRAGGAAIRLTTGTGTEAVPAFSPDGKTLAFSAEYDGNVDVFTIPALGGVPKRVTFHPTADVTLGWTPDGTRILFGSSRGSYSRFTQFWTTPTAGGFPDRLPLPQGSQAAYSADGSRLAYAPLGKAFTSWKRYRGGMASYLWIANLKDSSIEKIPHSGSNDHNPLWIGDSVYFLSDRDLDKGQTMTLYKYDTKSKKVSRVLDNTGLDLKRATAFGDTIAYEQFGSIFLFDTKTGKPTKVEITLNGDLPELRSKLVNGGPSIRNFGISPTGVRAVFEARGEIVTVPAEKGDVRNLTETPGVHERSPAWSNDGKLIAYFSEASGEYELHVRPQNGGGAAKSYRIEDSPSFYYRPIFSPDNRKIVFTDKRLNIWWLDLESGKATKVDTDRIYNRRGDQMPSWSPDSKWIAYSKELPNRFAAIFAYSLADAKTTQITDGMSDAQFPVFDKSGKYLYFTASVDAGPTSGEGLSSLGRQSSRSVYLAVLSKDTPSPFAPESDEEKVASDAPKPAEKPADPAKPGDPAKPADSPKPTEPAKPAPKVPDVRIDFEGISQRILALPVPTTNYIGLFAGKENFLFLLEGGRPDLNNPGPVSSIVHRYDFGKRKLERAIDGVNGFALSANGEKMLIRQQQRWLILPALTPAKPGEGALNLAGMDIRVDPAAEWLQMYREVWRGERDFFYSPNLHGLNIADMSKKYEKFVAAAGSREDLNYIFRDMLGELSVSHLYVGGGDQPNPKRVPGGLLGADYSVENGRYRFAKVYSGENWNPRLRAPLTQPGVAVREGEYLLAIHGRDIRPPQDIDERLEATSGKSVILKVGPNPDGSGSRDVTVVPIGDEYALRNLAWVEENRRRVTQLSGGRVSYVYLPDTFTGGYSFFNRYFFSQLDKDAILVDERYNGGGALADYVVDYLRRPLLNYIQGREGEADVMPWGAVFGPKVMLINEEAGSGGDAMPYYFRKTGVGPLIGKRTWGGLVRSGGQPILMDGGMVTAPDARLWSETGEWIGENTGISPDITVEQDPALLRQGKDPQLEAGVQYLLDQLKKNPPKKYQHPPFPDYQKQPIQPPSMEGKPSGK